MRLLAAILESAEAVPGRAALCSAPQSGDLPPDPLAVRTPAERDGTYPGAVRLVAVDRTFAVPTARSSRHSPDCSTGLALSLALDPGPQDHIRPLTCGAKGTRTPGLLDANQTLFQLSYSPEMSSEQGTRCAPVGTSPLVRTRPEPAT